VGILFRRPQFRVLFLHLIDEASVQPPLQDFKLVDFVSGGGQFRFLCRQLGR
jgi:hypothetical protein